MKEGKLREGKLKEGKERRKAKRGGIGKKRKRK